MNATLLLATFDVQWVVWPTLVVIFSLGLLATFAPGSFAAIAARGGKWVDTRQALEFLDKPIDVDQHVLRYSRVFGLLVAAAALWLAYVYWAFAR